MNWIPVDQINTQSGWIFNMGNNMNGYSFVSGYFTRYPTFTPTANFSETFLNSYFAESLRHTEGYGGFDALLFGNLVDRFNFTSVMKPADRYGDRLHNGSFTGKRLMQTPK